MSHYAVRVSIMRDQNHLLAALQELGFAVEVHATPQPLQGYGGSQGRSAEIIVRKESLNQAMRDALAQRGRHGVYGDLGFVRGADGTFQAVIDDLDETVFDSWRTGRGTFLNQVAQEYETQSRMAWGIQQGFVYQGREDLAQADGTTNVQLLFAVRE